MHDDLPSFLILGAAKAGTTWLHDALGRHPQVYVSEIKETAFFCNDVLWAKGVEWYRSMHFSGAGVFPARGEATPQYLPSERAPERVREVLGTDVRLIVVLRDPVDRAWSWYWHVWRNGMEPLGFEEALEAEPARLADPERQRTGDIAYAYFTGGLYAEQLARWLAVFPREQLLVVLHHDIVADPEGTFAKVCAHVGVPVTAVDLARRTNEASVPRSRLVQRALVKAPWLASFLSPFVPSLVRDPIVRLQYRLTQIILRWNLRSRPNPKIPADLERDLRERFAPSVRELQALIGRDLSEWLP